MPLAIRRWFPLRGRAGAFVATAIGLLLLSGCGGGEEVTTLQGKVTYKGQPVTAGLINFMVEGGRPQGGGIQSDGSYQFDLPPGDYKIRIDTPRPNAAGSAESSAVTGAAAQTAAAPASAVTLPPEYAGFETSGLTVTVGSDSPQTHDIQIP
jgi:hypothetical protein